jgi:hypothetical protein
VSLEIVGLLDDEAEALLARLVAHATPQMRPTSSTTRSASRVDPELDPGDSLVFTLARADPDSPGYPCPAKMHDVGDRPPRSAEDVERLPFGHSC